MTSERRSLGGRAQSILHLVMDAQVAEGCGGALSAWSLVMYRVMLQSCPQPAFARAKTDAKAVIDPSSTQIHCRLWIEGQRQKLLRWLAKLLGGDASAGESG